MLTYNIYRCILISEVKETHLMAEKRRKTMFLLDVVSPMQAFTYELTEGPLLAVVAALVGAGIAIAAFFVFKKKK